MELRVVAMAKRAMLASQRSMPSALTGAGTGDGAEGRVGGPAGEGCAGLSEGGAAEGDEGGGGDPEAGGVGQGKGHAAAADLGGKDEVAEAGLGCGGEHEEEHDRAVDGHDGEVGAGKDALEREVGPDEVDSHVERESGADDDGDKGEQKVLDADDAVVGGEDAGGEEVAGPAGDGGGLRGHGWTALRFDASQAVNSAGARTRRLAFMR